MIYSRLAICPRGKYLYLRVPTNKQTNKKRREELDEGNFTDSMLPSALILMLCCFRPSLTGSVPWSHPLPVQPPLSQPYSSQSPAFGDSYNLPQYRPQQQQQAGSSPYQSETDHSRLQDSRQQQEFQQQRQQAPYNIQQARQHLNSK